MKSKDAYWAIRHQFDVVISGALQAESLGLLSFKIVPLDPNAFPMQIVLPDADRGSFSYICTAFNGASSFVIGCIF